MEPKDSDKSVIAKPVHSRLTTSSSNFRPFSELLAGAVTAIRPKIIRLKSVGRSTSVHQAGIHGVGVESTSKTTVVNKSLAKMVSSTTVSQLTDMDISNSSHQQTQSQVEAHALIYNTDNTSGSLEMASENNRSSIPHATTADRPSYDGYNWRKYGEKLIKESKHPRSYYKCNHPSCPVKKTAERSSDGVLEIIYKGEHNHLKPQFSGSNTFGGHEKVMSNNILGGGGVGLDSPTENQNGGISGYCEKGTIVMEPATHEPESKRRKNLNQSSERVISGESAQENRFVVQIPIDSVMKGDGFRWRKYGQKIVKGNPYPRSYYRCTDPKCNVRKHVERAADDPSMLITTYEGEHNHEMQIKQKKDNTTGSLKMASENDWSSVPHATAADHPSYDEYYWRKFGEKLVKGSKYPRSYYKCTHPSCPVKKTVERSSDGDLETVFKVEHNHLKPQFSGRVASGGLEKVISNNLLGGGDDSCGISGDCEMGTKVMKPAAHEPESKRRKNLNQFNERVISGESAQDPHFVVQIPIDSVIKGDGFRWRKYGQKIVKGNPYPRSYYRCTETKCNVQKHVERAAYNPNAFITTYEGNHNHEMTIKTKKVSSDQNPKAINTPFELPQHIVSLTM